MIRSGASGRRRRAPSGVPGKLGIIRLTGTALANLRRHCYLRDEGACVKCGREVYDSVPEWHPLKYDMMHKRSRGAGGSDTLDNVETGCHECHMKSHNAGGKPVPAK
jgi:5-methylcytosine-specific restriction endonuclease McrA